MVTVGSHAAGPLEGMKHDMLSLSDVDAASLSSPSAGKLVPL